MKTFGDNAASKHKALHRSNVDTSIFFYTKNKTKITRIRSTNRSHHNSGLRSVRVHKREKTILEKLKRMPWIEQKDRSLFDP